MANIIVASSKMLLVVMRTVRGEMINYHPILKNKISYVILYLSIKLHIVYVSIYIKKYIFYLQVADTVFFQMASF